MNTQKNRLCTSPEQHSISDSLGSRIEDELVLREGDLALKRVYHVGDMGKGVLFLAPCHQWQAKELAPR